MRNRLLRSAAVFALTSLVTGLAAAAPAEPATIAAVWKVREVSFLYRSSQAIYSCSALQGRITSILRAVGARDDVSVDVSNCDDFSSPMDDSIGTGNTWNTSNRANASATWRTQAGGFPDRNTDRQQMAHVRIRLMMPTEVTPKVLDELDKDKSRRALVSRLTGNRAAMYDDPVVFTAQRQPVTLSRSSIGLEPVECELLEQLSTSVFRQLDIRVVRRSFSCDRNQVSHIAPQMTVESLMGTAAPAAMLQWPAAEPENKDAQPTPSGSETQPAESAPAVTPG